MRKLKEEKPVSETSVDVSFDTLHWIAVEVLR